MTGRARMVIAAASIVSFAAAVLTSLRLGPIEGRIWLSVIGVAAIVLCFPSLLVSPRDLLATVVASLAPLMALASEGEPSWLIGPVAALLLLGAELNALCWEMQGPSALQSDARVRVSRIAALTLLGLAASFTVTIAARSSWLDGTVAVAVASCGLAALAWLILPTGRPRPAIHTLPLPSTTDPPEGSA